MNIHAELHELWNENKWFDWGRFETIDISVEDSLIFVGIDVNSSTLTKYIQVINLYTGTTVGSLGLGREADDASNLNIDSKQLALLYWQDTSNIHIYDYSSFSLDTIFSPPSSVTFNLDVVEDRVITREIEFLEASNDLVCLQNIVIGLASQNDQKENIAKLYKYDASWNLTDSLYLQQYYLAAKMGVIPGTDSLLVFLESPADKSTYLALVDMKNVELKYSEKIDLVSTAYNLNITIDTLRNQVLIDENNNGKLTLFNYNTRSISEVVNNTIQTDTDFGISKDNDWFFFERNNLYKYNHETDKMIDTIEVNRIQVGYKENYIIYYKLGEVFVYEYKLINSIQNTNDKFNLYPNPFTDQLLVDLEYLVPSTKYIEILNIMGNVVHKQEINNSSTHLLIKLKNLPSGTYFVKIGDRVEKVVKR